MTKLEYKSIYDIVGAAQEVHKTLGRGLSELIYQEAFALEIKVYGLNAISIRKIQTVLYFLPKRTTRPINYNNFCPFKGKNYENFGS